MHSLHLEQKLKVITEKQSRKIPLSRDDLEVLLWEELNQSHTRQENAYGKK